MKAFIWISLVITALNIAGKLTWLVTGHFPMRTPKESAIDIAFYVVMVVWAAILLAKAE